MRHAQEHFDGLAAEITEYQGTGRRKDGDAHWPVLRYHSHASAGAMLAWFRDHDLERFKQCCYAAGKLETIEMKMRPAQTLFYPVQDLFHPLMSDCEELIAEQLSFQREDRRSENPKMHDFLGVQGLLAVRGDWPRLKERSELFLREIPAKMKNYAADHRFFVALADADETGMVQALTELTSPRVARFRSVNSVHYTDYLLVPDAASYAKIAWRHGFKIHVDTPYIPPEWLPVSPLPHYEFPYNVAYD